MVLAQIQKPLARVFAATTPDETLLLWFLNLPQFTPLLPICVIARLGRV